MSSRQVQKLSPSAPRRSVRPARPRWNAWLWRFASPGRPTPWRSSAPSGATPPTTLSIRPSDAVRRTSRVQPAGSSADSNHSLVMAYIILMSPADTTPWLQITRGGAPLVVSMPHTGTEIPADLEPRLASKWLARKDTDWWIEKLYDFAPGLGATVGRPRI